MNLDEMDKVLIEEISIGEMYIKLYTYLEKVQQVSYVNEIAQVAGRIDWLNSLLEVRWDR